MTRFERALVYPVLALLCAATAVRLRPVAAEGPPDGTFGVVTVREIRVVGADGAPLVVLNGHEKGGRIQAFGPAGQQVIYLGAATDSGNGLLIAGSKDGARGIETAYGVKGGYVMCFADTGKQAAYVGAASDTGAGLLSLSRATDGQRELSAYATLEGAALALFGPDAKLVADLTSAAGAAAVTLVDGKGGSTRIPAPPPVPPGTSAPEAGGK